MVPLRAARQRAPAHRARVPAAGPPLLDRADAGRGGRPLPDARSLAVAGCRRGHREARRRDGGGRAVVEDRRPVPDLSAVLRRQQRRWRGRHPGDRRAPGLSGLARRGRHLALAGDGVPERRLGLRRLRLLCHRTRIRDHGRFRPAGRRGRCAWHPRPHGHSAEPHQRRAPVVRRVTLVAHVGPPGLVRLGRREGRRRAAEQLGQQLRRSGLDPRRGDRPVLLPQPPAGAARPQLVERGRTRRVRRHLPLLVRPGRGRVPH